MQEYESIYEMMMDRLKYETKDLENQPHLIQTHPLTMYSNGLTHTQSQPSSKHRIGFHNTLGVRNGVQD